MINEIKNLYECLLNSSSKFPKKTALVDAKKRISYTEFLSLTDRASCMFWHLGIRKGDRVAIVLRNSFEFVISYFALAKLGAVNVPVNFMLSKEEEIRYILENSRVKGIITQNEFLKNYINFKTSLASIEFLILTDSPHYKNTMNFWNYLKHAPHYQIKNDVYQNEIVSILYTSGTTGHPKGVILTHGNLISNARACIEALSRTENDVFLCLLPMFHTFSWTACVLVPVMLGARIVIAHSITPPRPWLNLMAKEGVTILSAIPQIFSVLSKEAKGFKKLFLKYWCFRKLSLCVSGAAPLDDNVRARFEKTFKIPLLEGYGLTETSPVVSVNLPKQKKHGSVGMPLPGVRVKIIDEHGRHLKPGEEGEICVHGPNITMGYHENEDATRELFTSDGWLKTGDIGMLDEEGFLYIRDRKKDMIIIKGLKVFPVQIEQILLNHPKIQEVAVIGVPDGEGGETIKCFCVAKKDTKLEKHEIIRFAKQHLDAYKRPREFEIVEYLPKNAMQKVLKRVLLKQELEKRMKMKL